MGDVSREIGQIVSATNHLSPNTLDSLTSATLATLRGGDGDPGVLLQIHDQSGGAPFGQICDTFGLLLKLARLHAQAGPEQFGALLERMGFSEKFAERFAGQLVAPFGPVDHLIALKWRVDISVVKKGAEKRPTVVMLRFTFKNDSFIVSLKSLDLLRNGVATMLNEIFKLKQSHIIKKR